MPDDNRSSEPVELAAETPPDATDLLSRIEAAEHAIAELLAAKSAVHPDIAEWIGKVAQILHAHDAILRQYFRSHFS